MAKKNKVANYRLREGSDYIPAVKDDGELFTVSRGRDNVVFHVNGGSIDFLSTQTRRVMRRLCKCADCGAKIAANFGECPCQVVRRTQEVLTLLHLFTEYSGDRGALNAALKQLFGCRTSEKAARLFASEAVVKRERYGGAYAASYKDQWKILSCCAGDEQYRREHYRQLTRKYRLSIGGGKHTDRDAEALFEIQTGACYFCAEPLVSPEGKRRHTKDHLTPVARGGSDSPANLALVCTRCNSSKNMKTEEEFWAYQKQWVLGSRYGKVRKLAVQFTEERLRIFAETKSASPARLITEPAIVDNSVAS